MSIENLAELEEGELLELPPRPPVNIKTNEKYESQYKSLEELGKGKFGTVHRCTRKSDGLELAAKFLRKTSSSKKEVLREIEMMNLLHHKRLISLFDAFETSNQMIVIMELVTGGELFEKIVEEDNLSEKQVIRYMRQVLYGVQHMHRKSMVHLDLKPENILCLGGGTPGYEEIKLIDFGMTRVLVKGKEETAMCGTPEFVAPEVITFNPITLASDMWSIGVITYVLLSGLSPFMGDDDNETLKNVTLGEYDFEDDDGIFDAISDEAKQFIEELLNLKPGERLTVDECLQHPWLQGNGSEKKLETKNLKKFIARRRWQRTMNTIKAVSRLAGGLSLFGEKSGAHGADAKGKFLERVKKQHALEKSNEDAIKAKEEAAKRDAEKRRLEAEKKEEERKKKEAEEKERKRKEDLEKKEAEKRRLEEERKKREAEERQKAAELRKKEAEKKRIEEEARKKREMEEAKRKEDEKKKKEEEQKRLEEARKKREFEEAEKRRIEGEKKKELEKKKLEEAKKQKELEEAAKKREEERKKAEETRKKKEQEEAERKKLEDKKKKEAEQRKAEELKKQAEEKELKLREEKKKKEDAEKLKQEAKEEKRKSLTETKDFKKGSLRRKRSVDQSKSDREKKLKQEAEEREKKKEEKRKKEDEKKKKLEEEKEKKRLEEKRKRDEKEIKRQMEMEEKKRKEEEKKIKKEEKIARRNSLSRKKSGGDATPEANEKFELERKKKRDEERERRRQQRKNKIDSGPSIDKSDGKENMPNGAIIKPSESNTKVIDTTAISRSTDSNTPPRASNIGKNADLNQNSILRKKHLIKENGYSSSGNDSATNSPNTLRRKTSRPVEGAVANRIAGFQSGDAFWKNKK